VIAMSRDPYHPARRGTVLRRGLSLVEIIVALAVLTGSAAVLAQMVDLAARHAERSRQITEAQTIAQNILNELLANVRPWTPSVAAQPVDAWSPWDYQIQIEPVGVGDLLSVAVTVVQRPESTAAPLGDDQQPATRQLVTSRPHYRLTRWVRRTLSTDNEPDILPPAQENTWRETP
jgi:prepilin-type N-terminal cleavage/methylation domain-containing protein